MGAYNTSDNALRGRGSGHARLMRLGFSLSSLFRSALREIKHSARGLDASASPVLNDLPEKITSKIRLYADDVLLYSTIN